MTETTDGFEAWIKHTSAFDRVQSIARSVVGTEIRLVYYRGSSRH
jgi:hypothetical protein